MESKNDYIRILAVLLSIIFSYLANHAQPNIDSIATILDHEQNDSIRINSYINKIMPWRTTDPKSGIILLRKFKQNSNTNIPDVLYARYLYNLGELYYNHSQPDSSEIYLQNAYSITAKMEENALKGYILLKLSDLYSYYNNIDQKTEMAIKAQSVFERLNDTLGYLKASLNVANTLSDLGRTKDAIQNNLKLLNYVSKSEDRALIYNSLSIAYEKEENFDSTYFYQLAYLKEMDKSDNLGNKFIAYYNIALTEQNLGKLELAESKFDKAIEIARASGIPILLPYGLISKAGLLSEMGNYNEATNLFNEASTLKLVSDHKLLLEEGYYSNYKLQGRFEDALNHHEQWKQLNDSLTNSDIANKTNELQIKYETERKENEINQLAYEKLIEQSKVKAQKYGLFGLGVASLFLGLLLYFIYRQNKRIKDKNILISKALQEKEVLIKEIHHRVKNNLQVISSLLSLQSRATRDNTAMNALEEGQYRVQSMALIHEHLYKGEKITSVGMKSYLSNLCNHIFLANQIDQEQVNLSLDIEDIDLDISTVVPLGLVLNELITNSCKYAFPDHRSGLLSVILKEQQDILIATVSDNGIGKSVQENKLGFGTKLIKTFAKKLNAEINEIINDGTSITLLIKSYNKA